MTNPGSTPKMTTELQTTGYKLNRIFANKMGEFKWGYGYLYGPEVEARAIIFIQGLRRSLTREDALIVYYRTPDGHETMKSYNGATTGFAYINDEAAAEAEWEAAK